MDLELIVPEKLDIEKVFVKGEVDWIIDRVRTTVDSIVRDIETPEGRKSIASVAYKVAQTKSILDKAGKEHVAGLKSTVKMVDASRKKLRDNLDRIRDDYRSPLTEWEAAEKRRQEEEARKEQERVNNMVAEMLKYAPGMPVEKIVVMSDEEYTEAFNQAKIAHDIEMERQEAEKKAEAKAKADEEKRLAEERAEIDRKNAELRAEREKIEAEKREIELEKAKVEAAEKAKREAEEAAERAKLEAEQKAAFEKAEAEKQERLKPDKEKLFAFAQFLEEGINYPEVLSIDAETILGSVELAIRDIAEDLVRKTEHL